MTSPDPLPVSKLLVGTWELLAREGRTHAGELREEPFLGSDPIAMLIFDAKGNFSAQFMKRDRGASKGNFDAYCGTYVSDDAKGVITTTLKAALNPENVGQSYTRGVAVQGDTLTITLDAHSQQGEPVVRTLTWGRIG